MTAPKSSPRVSKQTQPSGPVRRVEGDRDGRPVAVFHRFNRETWQHGYTVECDICTKAGQDVEYRIAVLAHFDRAKQQLTVPKDKDTRKTAVKLGRPVSTVVTKDGVL